MSDEHLGPTDDVAEAQLFVVPPAKFVAMSLCTFGIYEVYWTYKNWRAIKDRDNSDIRPLLRAFFYPLFHYSLLSKLSASVSSRALSSGLYRGIQAFFVLVLSALWRLPDPYWLLSFLTVVPFFPAVAAVSKKTPSGPIEESVASHRPANFVAYFLGGPLLAYVCLGSIGYFPSTAVISGDALWHRDIAYLHEAGILGPDEEISYFYSGGVWSIREDGQFISDSYVTSYWQDTEDGETYIDYVAYEEIEHIDIQWSESFLDMTVVTITAADEQEMMIWLSSEYDGDRKFVDKMNQFRNKAKNYSDIETVELSELTAAHDTKQAACHGTDCLATPTLLALATAAQYAQSLVTRAAWGAARK